MGGTRIIHGPENQAVGVAVELVGIYNHIIRVEYIGAVTRIVAEVGILDEQVIRGGSIQATVA